MTTIVINAVSVREGGSLVVLRQLLEAMAQLRPHWQWHVITNAVAHELLPAITNTRYHLIDAARYQGWRIRWWYETALPSLLQQLDADLLFSQTNYLPSCRLCCPSLLLVQHAGHFSPLFSHLIQQRMNWPGRINWWLKGRWVRSSVRHATRVTVQTAALADAISVATGVSASAMTVIAHGPGLATPTATAPVLPVSGQPLRIGYITKAGVQKNFAVLLRAAARLRQQGLQFVLVLTLDPALSENRSVLQQAASLGVADVIDNRGELGAEAIAALYRSLHCFVFASLCESFGFPLVEAMAWGLPLCVADTASNREVTGNAGQWFAMDDDIALASCLTALASNADLYAAQSRSSSARANAFSWQTAARLNVRLMETLLPAGVEAGSTTQ